MANTKQSGETRALGSRRIVKWAAGLCVGFFAFAPPGTMIVIVLLASRFLGISSLAIAALGALSASAAIFILLQRGRAGK